MPDVLPLDLLNKMDAYWRAEKPSMVRIWPEVVNWRWG
jgi:hypothetical protein